MSLTREQWFQYSKDLDEFVKEAKEKAEKKEKSRKSRKSLYAGLGTAALAAPIIYAAMRRKRLSDNPLMRQIQEASGGKFVRTTAGEAPKGRLARWWDRMRHSADELYYSPEHVDEYGRVIKPVKTTGAVHHFDPEEGQQFLKTTTKGMPKDPTGTAAAMRLNERIGENKLREAKFWERYAPGAMPKTEDLGTHMRAVYKQMGLKGPPRSEAKRIEALGKLQERLRQTYGDDFIMKELGGAQSAGIFPRGSDDLAELYQGYMGGSSRKLRQKMLADEAAGRISTSGYWDKYYSKAKEDPYYGGRVLEQLFSKKKGTQPMVQKMMPLEQSKGVKRFVGEMVGDPSMGQELRVHSIGGTVDPGLVTPRWDPSMNVFERKKMREAAKWMQEQVNKLPEEYRSTAFAADVVPLKGGGFTMIESNPMGTRSGLLLPETRAFTSPYLRRLYTGQFGRGFSGGVAAAGATGLGLGAAGATAAGQRLMRPSGVQPPAQPAAAPVQAPQPAQAPQQAAPVTPPSSGLQPPPPPAQQPPARPAPVPPRRLNPLPQAA